MNLDLIQIAYHPVESAIIRIALRLPRAPDSARRDLWNEQGLVPAGIVHLEPKRPARRPRDIQKGASNAVARLVLTGIEGQLPAIYLYAASGIRLRPRSTTWRCNVVRSLPLSLFEVCWYKEIKALEAFEHYHLGWLPGFDTWVVTGSNNSGDSLGYGYFEEVLGYFNQCDDPATAACQIIENYWRRKHSEIGQTRWVEIVDGGRVSAAKIGTMADAVWPEDCR